jgi:hypothetical protein
MPISDCDQDQDKKTDIESAAGTSTSDAQNPVVTAGSDDEEEWAVEKAARLEKIRGYKASGHMLVHWSC